MGQSAPFSNLYAILYSFGYHGARCAVGLENRRKIVGGPRRVRVERAFDQSADIGKANAPIQKRGNGGLVGGI